MSYEVERDQMLKAYRNEPLLNWEDTAKGMADWASRRFKKEIEVLNEKIKSLENHIEKMSCCCAGCTKHNLGIENERSV